MNLPPKISDCECKQCKEKGKVCWENDKYQYTHVRVDGCIERYIERLNHLELTHLKKADCAIFRPTGHCEIYAFIIEVKSKNYDLDEVKEKIENTLNVLDKILNYQIIPVPILYAELHRKKEIRYVLQKKVKYKGRAYLITPLKYCDKIEKAMSK
jgi:hypothetical protein